MKQTHDERFSKYWRLAVASGGVAWICWSKAHRPFGLPVLAAFAGGILVSLTSAVMGAGSFVLNLIEKRERDGKRSSERTVLGESGPHHARRTILEKDRSPGNGRSDRTRGHEIFFEPMRPVAWSKAASVVLDNLLARGATPLEQLRYAALLLDFAEQHSVRNVRAVVEQFAGWFVHLAENPNEAEVESMKLYGVAADLIRPFSTREELNAFEATVSRLLDEIRERMGAAKETEANRG